MVRLADLLFIEFIERAVAQHRILPTFYWALLENWLVLHIIKIGTELAPIRRKRTNVVSLLFTLAVDAETVREVDIPGLTLFLELCVLRKPLDIFSLGVKRHSLGAAGGFLGLFQRIFRTFLHLTMLSRVIQYSKKKSTPVFTRG